MLYGMVVGCWEEGVGWVWPFELWVEQTVVVLPD